MLNNKFLCFLCVVVFKRFDFFIRQLKKCYIVDLYVILFFCAREEKGKGEGGRYFLCFLRAWGREESRELLLYDFVVVYFVGEMSTVLCVMPKSWNVAQHSLK